MLDMISIQIMDESGKKSSLTHDADGRRLQAETTPAVKGSSTAVPTVVIEEITDKTITLQMKYPDPTQITRKD
jgi:hypothetical protein